MDDASLLHGECARLVRTRWSRSIVDEVTARLFGRTRMAESQWRENDRDECACLRVAFQWMLCVRFRDEKVA